MGEISDELREQMKNVDVRTVDPDTLVDIKDIIIDTSLTKEERVREFVKQIKNPYCYKCGKLVVKVNFADTNVSFEERMESYLRSLQE